MPTEGSGKATVRVVQRRFRARIEPMDPAGAWSKNRSPFQVDRVFGSKARVPVKGTMNGIAFKASLFPEGDGTHYQGDEEAPCPEKRTAYVVVGAKPQPPHMRIPLGNQGFFITLP